MPTCPRARDTDSSVTSSGYAMTPADATAIATCLSATRIGRYTSACRPAKGEDRTVAALRLYRWNVEISAALMVPIHMCEVAIRNAVSDAITSTHGTRWPWNGAFVRVLPARANVAYSPRQDLTTKASRYATTGKVIPELRFAFWESMFTSRHDGQIWNSQLLRVLPNLNPGTPAAQLRNSIRSDLGQIRTLRNRIAHHEPIFARQIADDLSKMRRLIGYRSTEMRGWLDAVEGVTALIAAKP